MEKNGRLFAFAVAYWHTFTEDLSDPFGSGTAVRPWDKFTGMDQAKARVEAAFEFFENLGFHISVFMMLILHQKEIP